MKKVKWIVGLSLTGVLAVSGATYALVNSPVHRNSLPAAITANAEVSSGNQQQSQVVPALYTPGQGVSNNQQTPGSNEYGPGMMGGYGYGYDGNSGYGMMGGYGGNSGYGMMGGISGSNSWNCGGYGGTGSSLASKDNASVQADTNASLQNAKVDKATNSITYTGSNVKLVILGGPEQADGKFVIDGLVNPTLNIPQGANVTVEFVNADEGMPHAFEVTNAAPPYDYMSMMDGGIYPGSLIGALPEAQNNQYPTVQTSFKADQAGTFYYICQYPGHAAKGMYGQLVIK